ncbi:UBX domain-containing protein 6 [Ixodes scapularis]
MFWFFNSWKDAAAAVPSPPAPWTASGTLTWLFTEAARTVSATFSDADEFQLNILKSLLVILAVTLVLIAYAWRQHGQRISERFDKTASNRSLEDRAPPGPSRVAAPARAPAPPSQEAQRAAAAALARLERSHAQANPNWSASAIKAQARRELEQEQEQAARHEKTGRQETAQKAPKQQEQRTVLFSCPLLGPDVRLPLGELRDRIRQFLYDQLEEEPGLGACLLIHTCNPAAKVEAGVDTLCKYLTNIVDHPGEEKYRRIRLSNKILQERVLPLEGAAQFLEAAGFEQTDDCFVFPEDGDPEQLCVLRDALRTAEPVLPVLDRGLRVLTPAQGRSDVQLPDEFFHLTPEELLREQEARTKEVEVRQMLRTKAMRERDERRDLSQYKYALVRIRLPCGLLVEGTFSVHERLAAVHAFLLDQLEERPPEGPELLSPGGQRLDQPDASLLQLGLVPSVVLTASDGRLRPGLRELAEPLQ